MFFCGTGTTISLGSERSDELGYLETASSLKEDSLRGHNRAASAVDVLGGSDDVITSVFAELNDFLENSSRRPSAGSEGLFVECGPDLFLDSSRMTLEEKLKLLRRKEIQQSTLKRKKKPVSTGKKA